MTTCPDAARAPGGGALDATDDRDFLERTIIGWHLLFAGMVLLAGALLVVDGYPGALLPLGLLVVWYVVLAVPAMRATTVAVAQRGLSRRGGFVIVTVLAWIDPSSLVLLFALYPQAFAASTRGLRCSRP